MNVLDWLLEDEAPGVAYLVRTRLLGESLTSKRLAALRRTSNDYPPVAQMLDRIAECIGPGATRKAGEFHGNYDKYCGAYWTLIFLADMPRQALNDRFCEMVKEYVGNLGGGLVVINGPEFGLKDLQGTAIADMLPVVADPQADIRTAPQFPEFRPRLTPHADRYSFMRLGQSDTENAKAWDNLGKLPWYQPVAALLKDPGIIRHRQKIESAINNARRTLALIEDGLVRGGSLLPRFVRSSSSRCDGDGVPCEALCR